MIANNPDLVIGGKEIVIDYLLDLWKQKTW